MLSRSISILLSLTIYNISFLKFDFYKFLPLSQSFCNFHKPSSFVLYFSLLILEQSFYFRKILFSYPLSKIHFHSSCFFFPHRQTHLTFNIQLFSITIIYSSLFSSLSQRFYLLKSKLGFVINVWNLFWGILCPPSFAKWHTKVSNLLFCLFFHHIF